MEQDDITKQSPGAEIPKSQAVIISYDVSQIRGRRPASPWPVPCNKYHTRISPYTARTPLEARNKDFRRGELKASSQLT